MTIDVFAGGFGLLPKVPLFKTVFDNVRENEECLILVLSYSEDDLISDDKGLVELFNSVALVKIQDISKFIRS